jgi:DNA-binding MarR family transcriptional regulator
MTRTTTAHEVARRDQITRDLLTSLREVKGWFRDVSRVVHPGYPSNVLPSLALVERLGAARVSALAEAARVDVSVVSRQVQALENDGLVVRAADPSDRRASLVSLSEAGRRELEQARARMEALVEERLSGWSTAELADATRILSALVDDLRG